MKTTFALSAILLAQVLVAGGKTPVTGGGGGGVPVPGVSELRVNSETIPPGGTAQIQFALTEPKPIMTGTGRFGLSSFSDFLFGASVNSPAGDAYGIASYYGGSVNISFVSPQLSLGSIVDYPIVTLTTHVRADALVGSTSVLPANMSLINTITPITVAPVDGKLTVGGALFIHNVIPGGGTWPAGTLIRVLGGGFGKGTFISRATFRIGAWAVVSPTEIVLRLGQATTMDSQRIDITNSDKSSITYYSYLRGVEAVKSSEPLVVNSDPMYQQLTYLRVATQQYSTGINGTIFTALSVQNSNPSPVIVKIEAETPLGKIAQTEVTLAFGERITRELGEFFGQTLPIGATVKMTATLPVQVLGFTADRATGAVTPFMPVPF